MTDPDYDFEYDYGDGDDTERADDGGGSENADTEKVDGGGRGAGDGHGPTGNGRTTLTGISSRAWEHSADRAALAALRRLPKFDQVLRAIFGLFGEKPIRLAFQANAVQVGPNQLPRIWNLYTDVCDTLDAPARYPLFVSQSPVVNAGAYGMKEPFIILNSGSLELLSDDQVAYVLGHEVGHVMSDHVLYRTMTALLLQLAGLGFPIVGLAARAILVALLEWSRKSELSADRAGLLATQDPEVVMSSMLKMAGGGGDEETSLAEFIRQAESYRESGDLADQVFKVLNLLGQTHPFWVLRLSEIRAWIESGEYDRILRGEYQRRGDPDPAYGEDLSDAANAYSSGAKDFVTQITEAARRVGGSFMDSLRT